MYSERRQLVCEIGASRSPALTQFVVLTFVWTFVSSSDSGLDQRSGAELNIVKLWQLSAKRPLNTAGDRNLGTAATKRGYEVI